MGVRKPKFKHRSFIFRPHLDTFVYNVVTGLCSLGRPTARFSPVFVFAIFYQALGKTLAQRCPLLS
jgi:hypothetical protein